MVAYLVAALLIMATIAAIASYIAQNTRISARRQDMVNAIQYAQAGAAIACVEANKAYTNTGTFTANLTSAACGPYKKNDQLSKGTQWVYERTISSPFTNQTVHAQIWWTNSSTPSSARIIATATVGNSTQTAETDVEMSFSLGAAIISTAQGDKATSGSKGTAQGGDVVIQGGNNGRDIVEGGIISNGSTITNNCTVDYVARNLDGSAAEIPDYTSPGSLYQLFDFNRFIAVADMSGNHYTNSDAFIAAAATGKVLEGIVVVDILQANKPDLSPKTLPLGVNVRGTLVFNFVGGWKPLDKVINTADMNINPADLSHLNPDDPKTYKSGYPPKYTDPNKNPIKVDISSKGFTNFVASDDLPALMYNNAILDMHGNVNISGVVYSSSFMEIENKGDGQIQYFKGALIGGGGIYLENNQKANSIVSYDKNALDNLATAGTRGKAVIAVYRQ